MGAHNKYKVMRFYFILALFLVLAFTSGCYFDHSNLVYPQAPCSVTNATYSKNVVQILSTNCYSCHSGTALAGAGITLDNYTSVKTYVANGQLMNSINHTGGIPAMPLNNVQLSACDIKAIQTWIDSGTPNN
jgi:uncharacterized membrane protein